MTLDLPEPVRKSTPPPERIAASSPGCTLKRPSENDQYVRLEAAKVLAGRCLRWDPTSDEVEWITALMKERYDWTDGYKLARALERNSHVDPDSDLVDVLDEAYGILRKAHENAVREWVTIVGFNPVHAPGSPVRWRNRNMYVVRVDVETARYVVNENAAGNGGHYADAEDLESTPQVIA